MIGRNVKLYDMVVSFLRTLFLRKRNIHYCTLRWEQRFFLFFPFVGDWVGLWLDWSIAMIVPDFFQSGVVTGLKFCCDCAKLFSKWGCDWTEVLLWLCQTFFKVGFWLNWSIAMIVPDFFQSGVVTGLKCCCDCTRLLSSQYGIYNSIRRWKWFTELIELKYCRDRNRLFQTNVTSVRWWKWFLTFSNQCDVCKVMEVVYGIDWTEVLLWWH